MTSKGGARHDGRTLLLAGFLLALCVAVVSTTRLFVWSHWTRALAVRETALVACSNCRALQPPLDAPQQGKISPLIHELSLDVPYDDASTEVSPGVFRHGTIDCACPRFAHIEYHDHAGIGHRLSNLAMA